jgi:hypothetical protein
MIMMMVVIIAVISTCSYVGQDSSVGIATCYGWDGPGIEFQWERDFAYLSRPAVWLTRPPIQWAPGHSWE